MTSTELKKIGYHLNILIGKNGRVKGEPVAAIYYKELLIMKFMSVDSIHSYNDICIKHYRTVVRKNKLKKILN